MIFPILSGLMGWRKAPVTWAVFLLNLAILVYTTVYGVEAQEGLEGVMKKHYFVATQGRIYAQYLVEHPSDEYPPFLVQLAGQVSHGGVDRAEMLGQLAFRDFNFLRDAETLDYDGDQVALRLWRKKIAEIRELQNDHPSYLFGLNADDQSMTKWVSYIFVHSGWLHFFGNMLFMLIFGAALERQIGGLGFLVTFVLSGTFAAGVFALMTGVTSSPLVGASGAISGIMSLYSVLNWHKPARFFYWLFLPFRGFMGFVYLPAWVALVMWAINDVAGYVGSLPELGGIAHTAHLGGETAGLLTGLIIVGLRRFWPVQMLDAGAFPIAPPPMGVLIPFLPPKNRQINVIGVPEPAKISWSNPNA